MLKHFKPGYYFTVRDALIKARRGDRIGGGCDALIPAQPPKEALEEWRKRADRHARGGEADGDHYHTVANSAKDEKQYGARFRRSRLAIGQGKIRN